MTLKCVQLLGMNAQKSKRNRASRAPDGIPVQAIVFQTAGHFFLSNALKESSACVFLSSDYYVMIMNDSVAVKSFVI